MCKNSIRLKCSYLWSMWSSRGRYFPGWGSSAAYGGQKAEPYVTP